MNQIAQFCTGVWRSNKGALRAALRTTLLALLLSPGAMVALSCALPGDVAITVIPIVTVAAVTTFLVVYALATAAVVTATLGPQFLARVTLAYLLVGLYCSVVPISENRPRAALAGLVLYIVLFSIVAKIDWLAILSACFLLYITAIYFPRTGQILYPDGSHLSPSVYDSPVRPLGPGQTGRGAGVRGRRLLSLDGTHPVESGLVRSAVATVENAEERISRPVSAQ